jgi:hypothetical protein
MSAIQQINSLAQSLTNPQLVEVIISLAQTMTIPQMAEAINGIKALMDAKAAALRLEIEARELATQRLREILGPVLSVKKAKATAAPKAKTAEKSVLYRVAVGGEKPVLERLAEFPSQTALFSDLLTRLGMTADATKATAMRTAWRRRNERGKNAEAFQFPFMDKGRLQISGVPVPDAVTRRYVTTSTWEVPQDLFTWRT